MVVIMQNTQEKANLQKTKINAKKIRKFVQAEMNFVLEKNGGNMPSSLGGRLIFVVRQAGRRSSCSLQFFKFYNFNFYVGCLNRLMVLIALYQ